MIADNDWGKGDFVVVGSLGLICCAMTLPTKVNGMMNAEIKSRSAHIQNRLAVVDSGAGARNSWK
jgi:hypothetical protein